MKSEFVFGTLALMQMLLLPCVDAAVGRRSSSTFVFVRPEVSSFWSTARSSHLTIPVDWPIGASTATLTVRGCGYEALYANIVGKEVSVDLPEATSWSTENVYDLSLVFDNDPVTARHARIGLVRSHSTSSQGMTRCLTPVGTRAWNKVGGRAVFPVPHGATALVIDGEEVDIDPSGAQGWHVIGGLDGGNSSSLVLRVGEDAYSASLAGAYGCLMIVY